MHPSLYQNKICKHDACLQGILQAACFSFLTQISQTKTYKSIVFSYRPEGGSAKAILARNNARVYTKSHAGLPVPVENCGKRESVSKRGLLTPVFTETVLGLLFGDSRGD